ncbi:sensitivity to red-light reduced protein [Lobosporangium transversale]|uniref:SRR1-domain-containing protein n=1 Tax=Lobosporangium transversale TaxID=64571 RepID=A0A1Y2GMX2_9FUNG|nr:SRR1-domain-containing protein [Lobosporangium transversale]KAF9919126.1 sensitivity to red-light reduced protein [Lobosporangium transversale]ORZ16109.1 SRR1-domain-containing protein [Lobosporangium transversale]|eukprot:XP_021881456.1 SRR1-domain-containing protein [Lobosporangium transversale]
MSNFKEQPNVLIPEQESKSLPPLTQTTEQESSEEPFVFVTRKKKGCKQRKSFSSPSSLSQPSLFRTPFDNDINESTRESSNMPGWRGKKPPTIKKNSQRSRIAGFRGMESERTIDWGLTMMESRITTLKQSRFYQAFQELVELTLIPSCRKQRRKSASDEPWDRPLATQIANEEHINSKNHCKTVSDNENDESLSMDYFGEAQGTGINPMDSQIQNNSILEMVFYGIGSIENSRNSQFQLALGICLKEILQVTGAISIFDPIMTEYDKELVEKLGLQVLKVNDQAKKVIKTRTLLYMPHCPKGLYSHVLESNWERERLNNMVILGNRFTMYDESPSFKQLAKQAPFILPALSIAQISPFPDVKFEDNTIFNDLAFHIFPTSETVPEVSLLDQEPDPEIL